MTILLITVSILVAFFGVLFVNQATIGIFILGFACLLAILARIAQADAHLIGIRKTLVEHENNICAEIRARK